MKGLVATLASGLCLAVATAAAEEPLHPSDAPPAIPAQTPRAETEPASGPGAMVLAPLPGSVPNAAPVLRKPLGPAELPEMLPGRWKVSLCVLSPPGHAWIRYENVATGEVRSISRFHLLVGGWFDDKQFQWNYGPTVKTGVSMDREQSIEHKYARDRYLLLSTYLDNPRIYKGDHNGRGHGMAVNNCATYTRDAWYFYTGEYYSLSRIHEPAELRRVVIDHHPEIVKGRPAR
jgi:hypothetical protein